MKTNERFSVGDYVIFTAKENDDVPYGCAGTMERELHGKIFRVTGTKPGFASDDYQRITIETCKYTEDPERCGLEWNFSAPMFEAWYPARVRDIPESVPADFSLLFS